MSKVVKWGGAAVVVLGAAWAGLAGWSGHRLEAYVQTQMSEAVVVPALGELTLLEYERGWFQSRARYRFTLDANALPFELGSDTGNRQFDLDAVLEHGPWPWSRLKHGQFMPVLTQILAQPRNEGPWQAWFAAAQGQVPVLLGADVAFDGSVAFDANFAPVQLQQADSRLSVSAANVQGRASADLRSMTLEGRLDEASLAGSLEDNLGAVRVQGLRWNSDHQRGRFDLYPGSLSLHINSLLIETTDEFNQPLPVLLRDYHIEADIQEQGEFFAGSMDYGVGQVVVRDIELGELDTLLRFERLHGPTLQQMQQRYYQLTQQMATVQPDAEEFEAAILAWFEQGWQELLPYKPMVALDPLRWQLGQNSSLLQVDLVFQPPVKNEMLGAFEKLDVRLAVATPMLVEAMARFTQLSEDSAMTMEQARAAAALNMGILQRLALASGYVVADGDSLLARLSYAQGRLSLNGQAIDLPEELGQFLPSP